MKHGNLYSGLVLPSGGWQSLIVTKVIIGNIIDQDAFILVFLLKIQKQNTQTLKLFTEIIKTENYLQKLLNVKLEGLGAET